MCNKSSMHLFLIKKKQTFHLCTTSVSDPRVLASCQWAVMSQHHKHSWSVWEAMWLTSYPSADTLKLLRTLPDPVSSLWIYNLRTSRFPSLNLHILAFFSSDSGRTDGLICCKVCKAHHGTLRSVLPACVNKPFRAADAKVQALRAAVDQAGFRLCGGGYANMEECL